MRPIGRHQTSGLSLLLSAIRFFFSSSAHGCSGSGYPRPATSKNCDTGGVPSGGGVGAGAAPRPRPPPPPPPPPKRVSQMPEKSGLPSAVLGAGAARLALPSG